MHQLTRLAPGGAFTERWCFSSTDRLLGRDENVEQCTVLWPNFSQTFNEQDYCLLVLLLACWLALILYTCTGGNHGSYEFRQCDVIDCLRQPQPRNNGAGLMLLRLLCVLAQPNP